MKTQTSPAPEKPVENRQAARSLARYMWTETYKATHPDAAEDELRSAWDAAKASQIKLARAALRRLARTGAITVNAQPAPETGSA